MLATGVDLHVLRDPTRGGVVGHAERDRPGRPGVGIELVERDLPIPPEVRDACGLLGLDPLQVANEGKLVAFVPGRPGRRGAGRDAQRTRSAPAPGGSAPASTSTPGWWSRAPGSAAPGWWTCRSASSSRGSADGPPRERCSSRSTPTRRTSWATAGRTAPRRCSLPGEIAEIERRARQFEGAWSYLEFLAETLDLDDPLAAEVVEAYWVGSDLLDEVDPAALVDRLADRFRGQPGGTWRDAAARARAHHSFQVFEVYPWAELLLGGRPAGPAVNVLDRCRIRAGVVCGVDGETVTVITRPLAWDGASAVPGGRDDRAGALVRRRRGR